MCVRACIHVCVHVCVRVRVRVRVCVCLCVCLRLVRDRLQKEVSEMQELQPGFRPGLVVLQVRPDPPSGGTVKQQTCGRGYGEGGGVNGCIAFSILVLVCQRVSECVCRKVCFSL